MLQMSAVISDSLSGALLYTVRFNGREILMPSGIEIDMKDAKPIKSNLEIVNLRRNEVNETWDRVWGKRKTVTNRSNQLKLNYRKQSSPTENQPLFQGL